MKFKNQVEQPRTAHIKHNDIEFCLPFAINWQMMLENGSRAPDISFAY